MSVGRINAAVIDRRYRSPVLDKLIWVGVRHARNGCAAAPKIERWIVSIFRVRLVSSGVTVAVPPSINYSINGGHVACWMEHVWSKGEIRCARRLCACGWVAA